MRALTIVISSLVAGIALPSALSAAEVEFPARKAGQWQIDMDTGMGRAMSMQVCLDATTDAAMMQAGLSLSKDMCPQMNVTQDGSTITIDAQCTMGAMTTKSHTVMSGDFQSAYTVKITSDMEGAPQGMPAHSEITQQAKWTGDCADGLAPGEMIMPGGMKINVQQMMQMIGGGGG